MAMTPEKTPEMLFCPTRETFLKLFWINPSKYPLKSVMRRNSIGKLQKSLKPIKVRIPKNLILFTGITACDSRTKRNHYDIHKIMKLPSIDSWIYNPIEMLNDRTSLVIHGKSLQILNFGDILLGLSTLNHYVFNAEALKRVAIDLPSRCVSARIQKIFELCLFGGGQCGIRQEKL